jgi:ankyrin repeat protein
MKKYSPVLFWAVFVLAACASSTSKRHMAEITVFDLLDEGKTGEAQAFFPGKASPYDRDGRGRTPLHAAAETGNVDMVRFLLALGAEVDTVDNQGRTPLGIAASRADPETIRYLVAAGANIHRPVSAENPVTPALLGIRSGGTLLKALINTKSLNSRNPDGRAMIHLASQEGKVDTINILISEGAQLNDRDNKGKTALDYAFEGTTSFSCAETAEKLVLAGALSSNPFFAYFAPAARSANYNIRISGDYTALHYAAQKGYSGYVSFILSKKTDINTKTNSGATALHEAYRAGEVDIMRQLITGGADVNARDAKGNCPIHLAVPADQHELAMVLLLENGAEPNVRDEHGDTPLHVVIVLGRSLELVNRLLAAGADISIRNVEGITPLHLAVENNRTDLVSVLLENKADIFAADNSNVTPLEWALKKNNAAVLDALLTKDTVLQSNSAGNTPLHIAVKNKAGVGIVELILNRQGEVNARNREGNTALHIANIENLQPVGTLLISRGADIFAPNSKGETPLYMAFHSGVPVREWMLSQKTLEAKDGLGNTVLHYGAQWRLAAYVPLLVQKGSKLEAVNATGETPLFMAARSDSPDTIRALLAAGSSINTRDALGNSPLHSAVRWDARNSIDLLIDANNSVNAQNLAGKSPLHEAVRLGHAGSETLLISRRANIEIRDIEGNTPLMEAVMNGLPASVERLTRAGANPITRNNSGNTPLHVAVSMQRRDLITILLNNGVSIHARNSSGITPFHIALSTSPIMVSILLTKDRIPMADDDGLSPLHIALRKRSSAAIIQTIIDIDEKRWGISAVDSEGRTPLRLALDMGSVEEAKLLSDAGSDVFAPAVDGKTPAQVALARGKDAVLALFSGNTIASQDGAGNTILHYAAQTGKPEIISMLLELGANKNIKNIASESPADIAMRWNHIQAAIMLQ